MGYITSSYLELDSVRLGNKLWIIASMLGVALDNGMSIKIPRNWGYAEWFEIPDSMYIDKIEEGLSAVKDTFKYEEIKLDSSLNYDFQGFFQQYKYFEKSKDLVNLLFTPRGYEYFVSEYISYFFCQTGIYSLTTKTIDRFVNSTKEIGYKLCSLHVRRGDYALYPDKHPLLPLNYYTEALSKISDRNYLMICSDDINWCMDSFYFETATNKNIVPLYASKNKDILELLFMKYSNTVIMANSSFSWWGAFFAWMRNKATVICPAKEQYYGAGNSHISTEFLYPSEWIQLNY